MQSDRKVLVTGFTGRLGGMVAHSLWTNHQVRPRVLVRRQHLERSDWRPPAPVDVCAGDYNDPESLDRALVGVDAVFLVSPVHPDMRQRELALGQAAAKLEKPPRIVKISGLETYAGSPVDSGRWHADIEAGLRDMGLSVTGLQPFFLMQNLAFQARAIRSSGELRAAVGDAAIAMVDANDVADVAACALVDTTEVDGLSVPVTGNTAYTYHQIATLLAEAFGQPVNYRRQSIEEAQSALEKSSQPDWHIQILLQFNQAFRNGAGEPVHNTVERVLGRAPATLQEYALRLAAGDSVVGKSPFPS